MPVWKILVVLLFGCLCIALGSATLIIPLGYQGGERWLWLGGLLLATLAAGGLFALFLRHASGSLDTFARGSRL